MQAVAAWPWLGERAPDAALAVLLEATDLDAAPDFVLVEVVAAWRRIDAWAAANASRAAAALSRRASMNPLWPAAAGVVAEHCVAGEELASRLGCSRRAARRLIDQGRAFDGLLAPVGEALERGDVDEQKARMFVRALAAVPGEVALAVQDEVLPRAGQRTHRQVAADIQRALVQVDPDAATDRAAVAAQGRRVCRPTVLPDGMAGIWSVLPAPAAMAVHGELDAVARRVRAAGDDRTLDQLRADALCAALLTRGGDGHGSVHAQASAHGAVRPGTSDDVLTDVLAGPPLAAQVTVVVPLGVLMGVSDGAAELVGYGAVDPATAEALARGGTWARLVTDPLSGALLDVGRTRYRPPADLDRHVRTRDGTCVRPGCSTSAWSCELDHTEPFGDPSNPAGGGTSADNLGALCKREHLLKTHGGFGLRQVAPGVFEWTTPTGHRYRRAADLFGQDRVVPRDPVGPGVVGPGVVGPGVVDPGATRRGLPSDPGPPPF